MGTWKHTIQELPINNRPNLNLARKYCQSHGISPKQKSFTHCILIVCYYAEKCPHVNCMIDLVDKSIYNLFAKTLFSYYSRLYCYGVMDGFDNNPGRCTNIDYLEGYEFGKKAIEKFINPISDPVLIPM